jgi:hypothetical protein
VLRRGRIGVSPAEMRNATMGDKSPKNSAKSKTQKSNAKNAKVAAAAAAATAGVVPAKK